MSMTRKSAPSDRQNTTSTALIMLFACAAGLSVANVYYAQPLLDAIAEEFAISHAAVGGVITATQVGSAAALLFLVPLGDRISRRRLILGQLAALLAALLVVAAAHSTAMLFMGMAMVGMLGTAMTQGLVAFAAASAGPDERGRVVGATQAGVVVGVLAARALSGVVCDLGGWRAVYLVSAAALLALGLILLRVLPAMDSPDQPPSYARLIRSMFTLLATERTLQVRGVIAFLMFATFSAFWTALVLPLSAPPHNLSHTVIGAFGLLGALGALAAGGAGRFVDRGLGERASATALGLMLIAWVPLWFTTDSFWALAAGVVILDVGVQTLMVVNQTMIFQTQPQAQSRLVGCYMLFYSAGSGLGAIASTALYATAGWPGVCALGAGLSLAAAAFWAATTSSVSQDCLADADPAAPAPRCSRP